MKKLFIVLCFCAFSSAIFAQEDKPAAAGEKNDGITAWQTATMLANYGYEQMDAVALTEAARILYNEHKKAKIQNGDYKKEAVGEGKDEGKNEKVSYDYKKLLVDAKKMAQTNNDKTVLALINSLEKEFASGKRSATGGPERVQTLFTEVAASIIMLPLTLDN